MVVVVLAEVLAAVVGVAPRLGGAVGTVGTVRTIELMVVEGAGRTVEDDRWSVVTGVVVLGGVVGAETTEVAVEDADGEVVVVVVGAVGVVGVGVASVVVAGDVVGAAVLGDEASSIGTARFTTVVGGTSVVGVSGVVGSSTVAAGVVLGAALVVDRGWVGGGLIPFVATRNVNWPATVALSSVVASQTMM